MIDEIQVENLALIRHVSLVPSRGLTVLTGETGAGKTALLSALKLLMGERADKSAVREGASSLEVSGRFFLDQSIDASLTAIGEEEGVAWADEEERGIDATEKECLTDSFEEDLVELVALRRVSADGRSRVSINGHMASVGELAAQVAPHIDLCGQHEHQRLMKPAEHIKMLDAWAQDEIAQPKAAFIEAFFQAKEAARQLERVREATQASSVRLDEARFILRQIDAVGPREGEYEELSAELARAEHSETLATAAQEAYAALSQEGGALDSVGRACSALENAARYDVSLGEYAASLREASYLLEDVARETRAYRDSVEFDPQLQNERQERMAALQGLLRSYGPCMEEVLARRAEAAELVSLVDDADLQIEAAQRICDEAEEKLAQAAEMLERTRSEVAPRFAEAVSQQMARLEMGKAQLVCQLDDLPRSQWNASGSQAVEFLFRPGAGMQARPLARIASGGEISRVMLAIKVVLGQMDEVDTLVFDEVDAGVGGAAANALAEVLVDLAKTHQVLVVTHLAQVAVRADAHYLVCKQVLPPEAPSEAQANEAIPETELRLLSKEERPAEIARMLSGDSTDASLAHAREMLAAAGN